MTVVFQKAIASSGASPQPTPTFRDWNDFLVESIQQRDRVLGPLIHDANLTIS